MKHQRSRRHFLQQGALLAASAAWGLPAVLRAAEASGRGQARVAVTRCAGYGPEFATALRRSFDLLGGLGGLVKGKTVTVKVNLTGTNFMPYLGLPVGETYMTHPNTVLALNALLFEAGARRVRYVESTQSKASLEQTVAFADWDVNALRAAGAVEFENTRNLGRGRRYAQLQVPDGGRLFSSLQLNQAYEDTDVMVSLAKMKNHVTAGLTLSMKNLFGLTPNSLYGDEAGSEEATAWRGPLHGLGTAENPQQFVRLKLPGLKEDPAKVPNDGGYRVPRIITDICAARPIHLAILDGISTIEGGEGPWCSDVSRVAVVKPGVLLAGLNPVATDAVAAAIMGYDPRAGKGTNPFDHCDNHLLLAEQAGLGTADLKQIEVLGETVEKVRHPFHCKT